MSKQALTYLADMQAMYNKLLLKKEHTTLELEFLELCKRTLSVNAYENS